MIFDARRLVAVGLVLFAAACSGSSSSDIPSSDPANDDDTSEDELNTKARFTHLKTPTDKDLAALAKAGGKLENAYRGVYRFNKAGPEATDPNARMNRVKEVMHRYMCSFFDESIDIGRNTGTKAVEQTMSDVDFDRNSSDEDANVKAFGDALGDAFENKKLDIMSGGASGNNTAGEVMGIYDLAHNEVFFFGYTNCGSDD